MAKLTITNKTTFPTADIRRIFRACLTYRKVTTDKLLLIEQGGVRSYDYQWRCSARNIVLTFHTKTVSVPAVSFAKHVDTMVLKTLGASRWDAEPEAWFDPAKHPANIAMLTDDRSRNDKIQDKVDQRALTALRRVANLEKRLKQLETNKKRLRTNLKNAKAKVKYYDKSMDRRTAREARQKVDREFLNGVKAKAEKSKEWFNGDD